ncbi:hypothetical protein QUA56_11950 [Microcoleus sp. N3A4]
MIPRIDRVAGTTFEILGQEKAALTLLGVSLQKTAAGIRRYRWKIEF